MKIKNPSTDVTTIKIREFSEIALYSEKMEIVDKAKKIQTYEISILPYIDSCVAFAPKNPATSSNVKEIRDIEKDLKKLSELEENVLEKAEKFVF